MKKIFALYLAMCTIVACSQFEEPTIENERTTPQTRSGGGNQTFNILPNPYALDVMQAVYDDNGANVVLEPTDLYVRIMPQDTTQMNWLMFEADLELFNYPLDIEIENVEEYVDPTIPEGEPGWFYTTVEPDFVFPAGYIYEILEECYIPEEDETIEVDPLTRAGGPVDVERAAFEMLGYELEPEPLTRGLDYKKPTGDIMVFDNSLAYPKLVPVKGVKVRCHVVVKWASTYTDENGHYTMGTRFLINPHYAVVYENRKGFTLWDSIIFFATAVQHMGWNENNGHSKDIYSGRSWDWAVVNNAAYEYYQMCEETGIRKPPSDLKIFVDTGYNRGSAPMLRRLSAAQVLDKGDFPFIFHFYISPVIVITDIFFKWAEPDLIIGTYDKTYRETSSTVSHELSHASHFMKVGTDYWARYISHFVEFAGGYGDGSGDNAGICEVGEMWASAMDEIIACEKYIDTTRLNGVYPYVPIDNWIYPDPIWALITRGVLTKRQVYDCLIEEVDTVKKLENELCSRYNSKARAIKMAFAADDIPVIAGLENPITANMSVYTVPNFSGGVVFETWAVIGTGVTEADYQIRDSLTNRSLGIRFLANKEYLLTASYRLPDDTPDDDTDNLRYETTKLVRPININVSISGPDEVTMHDEVEYIVPATLENGYTLKEFLVSGGDHYKSTHEWTPNKQLSIEFLSPAIYTVTARYMHPGGDKYDVSRQVSVLPFVLFTPQITHEILAPVVLSQPIPTNPWPLLPTDPDPDDYYRRVKFTVTNIQNRVTYEWKVDGEISTDSDYFMLTLQGRRGDRFEVACRAHYDYGGEISEWSNTLDVVVPGKPSGPPISIFP